MANPWLSALTDAQSGRRCAAWLAIATAIIWIACAVILYEPFKPHPFDVIDFSEFLPFLREGGSFGDKLARFTAYFVQRGRANVATYALLVANYELWGENAIGWQLTRLVEFGVASVLLFILLRRLGATIAGASVAALLPVCARSAAPAWIRWTPSEPVGLAIILLMLLIALDFSVAQRYRLRIAWLCVLVALAIAFKEMYAALVLAVWAFAILRDENGRWTLAKLRRKHWELIGATGLTAFMCAAPIAWIALGAPSDSYASLYSPNTVNPGDAIISYVTGLLPFVPITPRLHAGVILADAALYAIIALGWRWFRQSLRPPKQATAILLLLLASPVVGTVSYLPWPNYQPFYALPVLFAPAALIGLSVSGFSLKSRKATAYAVALCALPFSFMLTSAHELARRTTADLQVAHEITKIVASETTQNYTLFASSYVPRRDWFGVGATLARQAAADGRPFPPYAVVLCDSARAILKKPQATPVNIVVLRSHCGAIGEADAFVTRRFRKFDWHRLRVVTDSSRTDIFRSRRLNEPL